MARRRRRVPPSPLVLGLAVLATDCARRPPLAHDEAPAREAPRRVPDLAAGEGRLRALFAPWVVGPERYGRRVLYTWTTAEQVDELRRDRVLLTRTESPAYGPSFYDRVMDARSAGGDRLAALVRSAPYQRARFAWTAPWATLLGWETERYGDRLVRVTLKPEAWIARYATATERWSVEDVDGAPVPLDDLLRHPGRLAAVHFVHDARGAVPMARWGTMGAHTPGIYREYVLCNEAMVEEWALATEDIRAELARGAEAMALLRERSGCAPGGGDATDAVGLAAWIARVRAAWSASPPPTSPGSLYETALALANDRYGPSAARLDDVLAALRAVPPDLPPLVHRPTAVFLPSPAARPPPRPRLQPGETY